MKTQVVFLSLLAFSIAGCYSPQMLPPGEYSKFSPEKQSYDVESDEVFFWMTGWGPLPHNLTIRGLSMPSGVGVKITEPAWVKGRPAVFVSINNASKIQPGQNASFEIWQGQEKKQTVKIGFEKPDKVSVVCN